MPEEVPLSPEDPKKRKEEQSRRYCVYMRPWTLVEAFATTVVPHISELNIVPGFRLRRKAKSHPQSQRSFTRAWSWYIHGQVVSHHQARIIRNFFATNSGCTRDVNVDILASTSSENGGPLEFDNAYCVDTIHALLGRMLAGTHQKDSEDGSGKASMRTAIQLGNEHWGLHKKAWECKTASSEGIILAAAENIVVDGGRTEKGSTFQN